VLSFRIERAEYIASNSVMSVIAVSFRRHPRQSQKMRPECEGDHIRVLAAALFVLSSMPDGVRVESGGEDEAAAGLRSGGRGVYPSQGRDPLPDCLHLAEPRPRLQKLTAWRCGNSKRVAKRGAKTRDR
jgi:hypothetical protein